MLEDQTQSQLSHGLYTEWLQSHDEGKRIDELQEMCRKISKQPPANETLTADIMQLIEDAPIDEQYPFKEPSDLNGIRSERPKSRHSFTFALTPDELKNKLTGAWLGRISGCLLGKPVEGFMRERLEKLLKATENYPLSHYIKAGKFSDSLTKELGLNKDSCWADNIKDSAPVDDDTNYTVIALKIIEQYGKDFRPNDVLETWLNHLPLFAVCTAERVAYRNAASGLLTPQTAVYHNPFREWIGAQIRADLFGYIHPADCEKAAEFAFRDASISHVKNGIYGEMYVAAMLAAAAVCSDIHTVIEAGLEQIPEKSRLYHSIKEVIEWHSQNTDWETVKNRIHTQFNEKEMHGWCHVISNAMIVTGALLYGNKDYGKSICLAVESAFDTDCNGATTGSIVGMMIGAKEIPSCWTDLYHGKLSTSILNYYEVSIDDLVQRTIKIINS